MTWPLAAVLVAGLTALVAMAWVVMPYVRKRSDHEKRLVALEAANVEMTHNMAVVRETFTGIPGMPRVRSVSR